SLKPISKDDPSVTASFYKHSPSLYICKQEDGEIYTVKVNEVQKMLLEMENYLNGKSVNTN
ncbi:MAG: hypothetical protein PHR24_06270, partial [Oscillospiraceae bacterium]|nr:hypothetical protein [Oscillospiraceae bacterium]